MGVVGVGPPIMQGVVAVRPPALESWDIPISGCLVPWHPACSFGALLQPGRLREFRGLCFQCLLFGFIGP